MFTWGPASIEMCRADAEVDLGRHGARVPLVRLEVGIVREGCIQALLHVAGMKEVATPHAGELLHRLPHPLYDGDGAILTDGAKALADPTPQVGAKRLGCKLTPLVRHEVSRTPVPFDREIERCGDVPGSGLIREPAVRPAAYETGRSGSRRGRRRRSSGIRGFP